MSFDHIFRKGNTRQIILVGTSDSKHPPPRKRWLLIGAYITHITGTASEVNVRQGGAAGLPVRLAYIATGISSCLSPLAFIVNETYNATAFVEQLVTPMPILIDDEDFIEFVGASTASVRLWVVEF